MKRLSGDDRSPEARQFIEYVLAVCVQFGFQIGHEDFEGGFLVQRGSDNLGWFFEADEMVE